MSTENSTCVIFTTCPSNDEAERLARGLVEESLAACVQITGIVSFYRWEGIVNKDPEWLLIIKTKSALYEAVERFIRGHHEYEVPEIIRISIDGGLPAYLNWIQDSCQ